MIRGPFLQGRDSEVSNNENQITREETSRLIGRNDSKINCHIQEICQIDNLNHPLNCGRIQIFLKFTIDIYIYGKYL